MIQFVQIGSIFLEIQNHACFVFEIFTLCAIVFLVCDVVFVFHQMVGLLGLEPRTWRL